MKKKFSLLMVSIIVLTSSCTQTVYSKKNQENISKRETVTNNEKVKEETITVSLINTATDGYRDYTFNSNSQLSISVILESENPQINFAIYYKGRNLSGNRNVRYWKTDSGVDGSLTIRVFLKNSKTKNISYKLRILQS